MRYANEWFAYGLLLLVMSPVIWAVSSRNFALAWTLVAFAMFVTGIAYA